MHKKPSRRLRVPRGCGFSRYCQTSRWISRGPVVTPAGRVLLPTHREVYGRCFRISAPRVSLPLFGSRAFSRASAFYAAASGRFVTRPCTGCLAGEFPRSMSGPGDQRKVTRASRPSIWGMVTPSSAWISTSTCRTLASPRSASLRLVRLTVRGAMATLPV